MIEHRLARRGIGVEQQRERSNVLDLVDTLWQRTYRPRMQSFLNNTQQAQGSILLSLPLDGEGRSVTSGKQSNIITVTFPERPSDAVEAVYVIKVPLDVSLDAELFDEEERAAASLAEARALGADNGVEVNGRTLRARGLGQAIVGGGVIRL